MSDNTSPPSSSPSHSQLLSSSLTSLSPSKQCSQTYKKASQLFLTRRLQESLAALEPVVTIPSSSSSSDAHYTNGDDSVSHHAAATTGVLAPIANAPSTWRIKVWNLYITLLSSIVDLGPDEGTRVFGQKEWKAIATSVRDGAIWETVVRTGYNGREGSVDVEVVYNLATLLLNHSASQKLNQQRLETYLSSYGQPNLDIAEHLRHSAPGHVHTHTHQPYPTSGTDTPKDLAARVRIIELFTLHVLPRNEEWEYAREFINFSEVLDEERKEVFLQTLEGLKEEKERGELRAAELQRQKDAELERSMQEAERRRAEEVASTAAAASGPADNVPKRQAHKRSGSEVDYGVDKKAPNGTTTRGSKGVPKASDKSSLPASSSSRATTGPSGRSSVGKSVRKAERPLPGPGPGHRKAAPPSSLAAVNALRNVVRHVLQSVSGNPMVFLRTLLFILGLVMALSRQDVRERIRRITGAGWNKVKGTIGMGVKVSYI